MTEPRLGEPVSGVVAPSVNMLATGGQDNPEEPTIAAGGLSLKELEVIFFAFDGTFGTRPGILMTLPEDRVSGDERMEAVVFFGIGVDDATIR